MAHPEDCLWWGLLTVIAKSGFRALAGRGPGTQPAQEYVERTPQATGWVTSKLAKQGPLSCRSLWSVPLSKNPVSNAEVSHVTVPGGLHSCKTDHFQPVGD